MATTRKSVTRQGLGNPESAVGQGGKAGPQASSSSDRSSTLVGNLAFVESNVTSESSCCIKVNSFCVVCGEYIPQAKKLTFSDSLKKKYNKYFGIDTSTLNNSWTPRTICSRCRNVLNKINKQIFSHPMIWRSPTDHATDCYFCLTNVRGYNRNNKNSISYPRVTSVTFPVLVHAEPDDGMETNEEELEVLTNEVDSITDDVEMPDELNTLQDEESDTFNTEESDIEDSALDPDKFNQDELSDLCRDLGLSKDRSELLASRLKEKKCLAPGTRITHYRSRERPFRKFFSKMHNLVYCTNIEGLVKEYKIEYSASDWRLFMDSSKRSLKAILLHNGNVYAPLPIAHSVILDEEYHNFELLLQKLKYDEHDWLLCGDLKIFTILLGQQSGNTSYPCFICEWNSRAREQHYVRKDWPLRQALIPGEKNIIGPSLISTDKVLLPPLHIKLGLAKQFVKAMSRVESPAFMYIFQVLPHLSDAKIKEGVFTGPEIRELLKNDEFERRMNDKEKAAWQSFRQVTKKFLGNNKDPDYKNIVEKMVQNFKEVGCHMNLKLHFLHSHLDWFPENLGAFSEEQGERMHQDLNEFEQRYQGVWGKNMLADYCWNLKRDTNKAHKRKAIRRSFQEQRKRSRPNFD